MQVVTEMHSKQFIFMNGVPMIGASLTSNQAPTAASIVCSAELAILCISPSQLLLFPVQTINLENIDSYFVSVEEVGVLNLI